MNFDEFKEMHQKLNSEWSSGGFLVPLQIGYEITTKDFMPSKPRWWQPWKKSKYKKNYSAWSIRFSTWQKDRNKI